MLNGDNLRRPGLSQIAILFDWQIFKTLLMCIKIRGQRRKSLYHMMETKMYEVATKDIELIKL